MRARSLLPRLLVLVLLALLAACGDTRIDRIETLPVDELYAEAKQSLEASNYERAARYYKRLVARFPFGRYTEQAELELGFAQYKAGDAEEALSTTNRFIRQYPTHPHIDYAYYLRGLINFNREYGVLERYVQTDATRRDLANARQSFQDFGELIQRFPNSRYAVDSRQRMIHLRNGLAQAELNVASYYLRRKAYIAAQTRAKFLIETYPQTPQTGDALAIMAESYRQLGQEKLADDALAVLRLNFPDHPYLGGGWPAKRSLWWQLVPFVGERRAG
ncbi:MAG: outer membrane protein assembly factor BamD [Xanthomonadaceae bacterium]|jgi:outer membrane protein assembly factor BamD|nr:outer membrane protein assembly factor BamD [Xanthomonadaceae bacterium]